jgi:hypothetical protein
MQKLAAYPGFVSTKAIVLIEFTAIRGTGTDGSVVGVISLFHSLTQPSYKSERWGTSGFGVNFRNATSSFVGASQG